VGSDIDFVGRECGQHKWKKEPEYQEHSIAPVLVFGFFLPLVRRRREVDAVRRVSVMKDMQGQ